MAVTPGSPTSPASSWRIHIANDNCPDYTWGLTETQTRQAFADVVRGHLDAMKATDGAPPESRDRYNAAATNEVLCFLERYPDRRDELVRRVKEGRLYVSPFLCNSLWGFQSFEGALRTMYPARRLERAWKVATDCAHHIELPSLPWGMATILAGCGYAYLTNPYLAYDTTFGALANPPIFCHEGPDGSRIVVWLDRWASSKANYTQGSSILGKTESIEKEWLPRYAGLGAAYTPPAILASGTHGDISPSKGNDARGIAASIAAYNDRPDRRATLVNATFPMFWREVAAGQARRPFLTTIRGCFGHSWEAWPVSLAKHVAAMREGERGFLDAEAILAFATCVKPEIAESTRAARERAEWCWAMLSDHAWNGTDDKNKRHNADLRRAWSEELVRIGRELAERGWTALGLEPAAVDKLTLFNGLSVARGGLVRIDMGQAGTRDAPGGISAAGTACATQLTDEDGRSVLSFVAPEVASFGFAEVAFAPKAEGAAGKVSATAAVVATAAALESPFYRLTVDPATGGVASLIHKATGAELVTPGAGRTLCQTVYFDGKEHVMAGVRVEPVVAAGPVFARLRISGKVAGDIDVTNLVTAYADVDRVDFDLRIVKPPSPKEERLCQFFPIMREGATLRIATTGAVIRPRPAPEGDLLPGADARRFAVQEFIDVSSPELSIAVVPHDAFLLRLDLGPIAFESIGNDQNYREVTRDQHNNCDFRLRYSLRARAGGYRESEAAAFGMSATRPLLAARGSLPDRPRYSIAVDPRRALATCLKPADEGAGVVLRLWEVGGAAEAIPISVAGFTGAVRTDLLERDLRKARVEGGRVVAPLRARGYCGVRLIP